MILFPFSTQRSQRWLRPQPNGRRNTARARSPCPTPRPDEEEGEQEDGDLGLGSRADQGDGKALGECARKKRQRQRQRQGGDRVFFSFFSSKTKMGWIRAERVRGHVERPDGDSRRAAEHGSPIAEPRRARNLSFFSRTPKNNLTVFRQPNKRSRHRGLRCALSARGYPLLNVRMYMRLLCDDNPRPPDSAEPQRPENPVV